MIHRNVKAPPQRGLDLHVVKLGTAQKRDLQDVQVIHGIRERKGEKIGAHGGWFVGRIDVIRDVFFSFWVSLVSFGQSPKDATVQIVFKISWTKVHDTEISIFSKNIE